MDAVGRDGLIAPGSDTGRWSSLEATGAALWAIGQHHRLSSGPSDLVSGRVVLARAVEATARRSGGAPPVDGLLAWTWASAGLSAAAAVLAAAGELEAARQARLWAGERWDAVGAAIVAASPAGPAGRVGLGPTVRAGLLAVGLLEGLAPGTAAWHHVVATARSACVGPACAVDGGGFAVDATLLLAAAEASAAEASAWGRVSWVLGAASPTWTWPAVIHPHLGTGTIGDGHDPLATASLWVTGCGILAADGLDGLALLRVLPPPWVGRGVEVHGLPTSCGVLSYALRWHDERPALLWEITDPPAGGSSVPRLLAPGLDRSWAGHGLSGEALLAPYEPPEDPASEALLGPLR